MPGIYNAGLFHIVGQPNLEIQIDRHECARYGINVSDVEAVVQVAVGGRAFTQMIEGEKRSTSCSACPSTSATTPRSSDGSPWTLPAPDGKPGAPNPPRAARQDRPAQAGRVVHLSREQPPLHPDQVQRAGARPGLDHRRGQAKGERPPARRRPSRRLRHRLVGRVRSRWRRPTAACSGSCRSRSA